MIWKTILQSLESNPRDLKTIPQNGSGMWFFAYIENDDIFVKNAHSATLKPSCSISLPRKITRQQIDAMIPIYRARKTGAKISKEAGKTTVNQVYIYSILKNCYEDVAGQEI